MRQLLTFLVLAAIVFFVVGEWRGWYIGIAGQTPVYVYKKDADTDVTRRTINLDNLPLEITGDLQNGSLRVTVTYERPASFQTGAAGLAPQLVFDRSFNRGQRVAIKELIQEGVGVYTVDLHFQDATGLFRVNVPAAAAL